MLDVLLEFLLDLFLCRWMWDRDDDTPWWALLLVLIVILGVVAFVGASTGVW